MYSPGYILKGIIEKGFNLTYGIFRKREDN